MIAIHIYMRFIRKRQPATETSQIQHLSLSLSLSLCVHLFQWNASDIVHPDEVWLKVLLRKCIRT